MKGSHGRDQPDSLPGKGSLVAERSKRANGAVDWDRVGTVGWQGSSPRGRHGGFHGHGWRW